MNIIEQKEAIRKLMWLDKFKCCQNFLKIPISQFFFRTFSNINFVSRELNVPTMNSFTLFNGYTQQMK